MNNTAQDNYNLCDFFMLRSPVLSYNDYKNLSYNHSIQNELKKMYKSPIVREAILVSSKSLYDSLEKMYSTGVYNDKALKSFIKYLIRMSTRTTPFGLFAGVTVGNFSKNLKEINPNKDTYKKYCRVDTRWLMNIIKKIERDNNSLIELKFLRNNTYIEKGKKLENLYVSHYGLQDSDNKYCSVNIKSTNVVKYVLEKCKKTTSAKEIIEEIQKINNKINTNTILELFKNLLDNEFIISELRPPLSGADPLEHVLNILKSKKNSLNTYNSLSIIYNSINEYNELPIGDGEDKLLSIIHNMSELSEDKNYLQVDLKLNFEQVLISDNIKKRIEKFENLLLKLSPIQVPKNYMKQYLSDFIEKYGTNREVDFLEAIDEELGIGFPASYMHPISQKLLYATNKSENELKFENLIFQKITDGLVHNKEEITITATDITNLSLEDNNNLTNDLPTSFELNFFISSDTFNNNESEISLSRNIGSSSVGKTLGRFLYMFNDEFNNKLKKLKHSEDSLHNDTNSIPCQISYLCENGRGLNVSLTNTLFKNELVIATNSKNETIINLTDLVIGVENNKFYLKSKKLNKRLNLYITHMLNADICSNVYRLLSDISCQVNIFSFFKLYYSILDKFTYTPRVKLDTVIVSPRTWKINTQILGIDSNKLSFDQFNTIFNKFRKIYNMPQYVFMNHLDNRLLLNLDTDLHLEILYKQISNTMPDLMLTESNIDIKNLDDSSVKTYLYEIVTSFIRNTPSKEKVYSENKLIQKTANLISQERIQFPFDKWIYIKLYGNAKREDEFLSIHLNKLIYTLKSKNLIKKAFFIRYKDPDKHIRVRFLKNDGFDKELIDELNFFIKNMYKEKLVSKVQYDTYEKEIERYGGIHLIPLAEKIFDFDSLYVMNLLYQIKNNYISYDKKIIGVINIIKFMEDFELSYEEQLDLLDSIVDHKDSRDTFIKFRKDLVKLCNSNSQWHNLRNEKDGQILLNLLELRHESIMNYSRKLKEAESKNELTNTKKDIILSLIHMHCNRFYGINRTLEKEIVALTRHTLYSLKFFKTDKRKNK